MFPEDLLSANCVSRDWWNHDWWYRWYPPLLSLSPLAMPVTSYLGGRHCAGRMGQSTACSQSRRRCWSKCPASRDDLCKCIAFLRCRCSRWLRIMNKSKCGLKYTCLPYHCKSHFSLPWRWLSGDLACFSALSYWGSPALVSIILIIISRSDSLAV